MLHEYRDPQGTGICAGCGRAYGLCRGVKRLSDALAEVRRSWGISEAAELLNARPDEVASVMFDPASPAVLPSLADIQAEQETRHRLEAFVERYGTVLRTPEAIRRAEELVARVAWLRLQALDGPERREFYASWDAYDAAMTAMARPGQERAEVYELERWLTL